MLNELKEYLPDFKDDYFSTIDDDIKIHYIESEIGEPLILTSGWPISPCIFAFNLTELSKYYHIIAIEIRGTGSSETLTQILEWQE